MDNADLEKLSISPSKLSPKFHANTTEYYVTVGSDVSQLKVDPLTSDCGACYAISGSGGGKTVALAEGQVTDIKIEVSAEDGTTIKNYFIHATRLSASDASLTDIKFSTGEASPEFAAATLTYNVSVPYHLSSIEISPVAADKKTAIKVNGSDNIKDPISLNFAETVVEIEVTSPDQSSKKTYTITICKQQLLRPIQFVDKKTSAKFECPICLGVLYRAKSIAGSQSKHMFCKSCIDELTRTSKQDPLDDTPLTGEWRVDEHGIETEVSALQVNCVFCYWGCTEKIKLADLGSHAAKCDFRLVTVEKSAELVPAKELEARSKDCCKACPDCNRPVRSAELDCHKANMCTSKVTNTTVQHKVEVRAWEKKLLQETNEKSADKLVQTAQEMENNYFDSCPKHGCAGQYNGDVSPLRYLDMAAEWYATAIKISPKNAKLHFSLAKVLEEQHYAQDLYGLKPPKTSEMEFDFNTQSKESAKEDDIQAICEMRGAGRNAPLSLQLKAIDEEYHYLLDQNKSDRAEYVQQLYAFKSKQALKANKMAQQASSEEEPLGKAYLKYMDALACSVDTYLYSLHVGRMLLLQGKPDEAVARLQIATGLKPNSLECRFYLGLSLAQQKSGAGKRQDEAIKYISEGLEYMLLDLTNDVKGESSPDLMSTSLLKPTNVQCLQGFITLAGLVHKVPSPPVGVMTVKDAYHCATLLSMNVLSNLVSRGDTYHQAEWILFQAHSSLLQLMLEAEENNKSIDQGGIARRCENLSALIKHSTIPPGKQLLELQEKTCQQAVLLQPSNSRSLSLLGDAQLRSFDNDPASENGKKLLEEAEQSFRVSIELEGKGSGGKALPEKITQQRWYKEKQAKLEAEKKAKEGGGTPQKTGAAAAKSGGAAGRGTPPARGKATPTRGGAAAARGRGAASTGRGAPAAARGRTPPARGAASTARGGKTASPATKTTGAPAKSPSHKSCSPTKPQTAAAAATTKQPATPAPKPTGQAEDKPSGPPNEPSHQARLGLARVLVRKGEDINETQKYYEEVISMAPEIHDAYIELADSLIKTDPMKAVDIYAKYPFKEPLTFDDGYIHGEIVRLMMKQEKYDDPRLGCSLISLGRVMGLTVIEKYVDILDKTFKYSKLLCQIYAGVHGKDVDDPDLLQFFKFKCWK